ncbi:polysaccharide biosynthesis/export family protein [Flavihumibacter petaseus]|uniref:Putative polysaccharide export protein n=1 Tax=Flavihumibacter petaseus NBRC 106054 TaxID=1220578 RepID=A0A0E9N3B1_9BACT|nr:polysaccharide biosynthesis/export family protein [Flavihumibacter petaseus]GAO44319.1 putative polysaccharide export protein [Flavihumibacter petaseus NBRC 106054]
MPNDNPDPIIQKGDILNITVSSLNPAENAIYNAPINSVTSANNSNSIANLTGYLVTPEGRITFPVLGEMKAAGLNKKQLRDQIVNELTTKQLLLNPVVTIRILNFRVTVLGEVGRPSVIDVPNEKISLLEAIGFAGDMTLYAKRDNVLLIRSEEGKKITRRINLNTDELFSSPYYYLKSNDIVYVESNKAKVQSTSRSNTLLPILLSALAFVAIIVDRVAY